ncbi:hypothetical protein [Steroidobacter sp.]|uniref:hypothetical protein n=1 Tax=Steroidobacter sp. TaxID=1978227 RepID=UPI001A3FA2F4|nr:hypothetical protein [Steroidobacter sp.]MBL8269959.1 hypothetical protein [Steroidobacter sp.]
MLILVAFLTAAGSGASDSSGLTGNYKFVPAQSGDVAQAIDKAVEGMNFIKRPIARGRLSKTNTPYQHIRIEIGASEVEIAYDTNKPIRVPLDGQSIKWTRDDGEVFDVSATFDGSKLLQTYKATDGTRVNSFSKDSTGSLRLEVEVSSPQLSQPVKYALVYVLAS